MTKSLDTGELLRDLSQMGSNGRAEAESEENFPRTLYPVPEHLRAFDPDVTIVLGPRGAGKTELFRAVMKLKLLPYLKEHASGIRLRLPSNPSWFPAYPIERDFPDAQGLDRFQTERGSRPFSGINFWFAYMLRVLWDELDDSARESMTDLKRQPGGSAIAIIDAFEKAGDAPLLAIDRLDERLEREDKHIFVGYDELDTLGAGKWATQSRAIADLIAFWSSYTRRWRRVRAKLFLRTDLFDRHTRAGIADLAKLAANRTEITWSDRNIHGLLLKRIANQSERLLNYCKSSRIKFRSDDKLGEIPDMSLVKDAKPLFDRMVGEFMGANRNKGLAYRWVLEHVRDGKGQALPRPLVRLVEQAADRQVHSGSLPTPPRLITPAWLRRALDTVSEEHVLSCKDEWPWLEGLKNVITGKSVPCGRKELELVFRDYWKTERVQGDASFVPPTDTPREFIDYLVEVGIFRSRTLDRIDAPDLFLAGLGLRRKGGVRKK